MKLIRTCFLTILIVAILSVSLVACDETLNTNTDSTPATNNTESKSSDFSEFTRGQVVNLDEQFVGISQSFEPAEKMEGSAYVSTAQLAATITGMPADFTYFSASVTITWIYNEISEQNPSGADKTFSATIGLDANGNGSYANTISFQGCRDVQLKEVQYSFTGTATKK